MNNNTVLYDAVFPAYLALIFTAVGFIPLTYNLVLNALILFPVIWIMNKRFDGKLIFKTIIISWLIAVIALVIGIIVCSSSIHFPVYYIQNDIEPTEEDYYAFSTACIYAGFIVGTMAAFAGHLFITFGKRFRESLPIKTWQRFVLSFVLTVVNAPYFVFISDTFLESLGITGFLPTMQYQISKRLLQQDKHKSILLGGVKLPQGDIINIVDANGSVVVRYNYDIFGAITAVKNGSNQTITDTSSLAFLNPLRYRGYVYDDETGLYYLRSRYYDPVTGRFLNADIYVDTESGSPLSANMYAYRENNALIRYDSNGIWYEDIFDFDQHLSSITNNE